MNDFLLIEYNGRVGGRVAHTTFGKKVDGTPYTIERGANWVRTYHSSKLAALIQVPGSGAWRSWWTRKSHLDLGGSTHLSSFCYRRTLSSTQAKKYSLSNTQGLPLPTQRSYFLTATSYSNFSNIEMFTSEGPVGYTNLVNVYEDAYTSVEQDAGRILGYNLQDRSFTAGLTLAGWQPTLDAMSEAIEWLEFDFEYGNSPVSSREPMTFSSCSQ